LTTNFGSFNTSRLSLEYDSGLSKNGWSSTFRYSKITSDGYREQSWLDAWNYYAAVEHYGERSTTRIVLFGGPEDTHLAYEGIPKPYLEGEITGDQLHDRRYNPLTYENEVDHFFQPHYQIHNSWRLS
jgi:iron complex outermembrane receptor protein